MDDRRIIELFKMRDEEAIASVSEKYGAYLFTVARNILRDDEDAKECVNDALRAAWDAIPPAEPEYLRAFLGKIARNIALRRYEAITAQKRGGGVTDAALDELSECIPGGEDPADESVRNEMIRDMEKCLKTVPERDRTAFLLRYWFAYTTAEIAVRIGTSENYVRTVLSRTRKKIRKYLERRNAIEE